MGIAAKLRAASKACRYVQKDGVNKFHQYKFASAANILGHVNDALDLAGAAVVDTDVVILSESVGGKDGKERFITAKVTLVVRDAETDETATFRGIGSGSDTGDKAVMKATTAAQKYAWILGLSIETGEDPEADEGTDRRAAGSSKGGPQQRGNNGRNEQPPPRNDEEPLVDAPPPEVPAALEGFYSRIAEIELPGEAVSVWMKHRTELATAPAPDREAAWKALCKRTEEVGKMKNAKVWLKKAIAEEDDRRARKPEAQS